MVQSFLENSPYQKNSNNREYSWQLSLWYLSYSVNNYLIEYYNYIIYTKLNILLLNYFKLILDSNTTPIEPNSEEISIRRDDGEENSFVSSE